MITYIGKCLLIEEGNENVLVVGDLHFGAGSGIGGLDIGENVFLSVLEELDHVFLKVGRVDTLVLLGDLKHGFSQVSRNERDYLSRLFSFLRKKKCHVRIILGNHDTYLATATKEYEVQDYFLWKGYCFLHGDRDFLEIYEKNVHTWVVGHLHPALFLHEGVKSEKYKCFLVGEYKRKQIIIVPSFSDVREGGDITAWESNLAWPFDLEKFKVFLVGEHLDVLDFGNLGALLTKMRD